ncbi:hypothetical protein [Loigolactobacillus jiayinensis]|uniref:Uncharacterized protein n=1 Tax=Loigolactobacillus jiayinensis TaxID=2486016 RepID=A0ABW1REG1_9LACO|nr:hypothetical protein [Loigolactobacillus jiayinensis]
MQLKRLSWLMALLALLLLPTPIHAASKIATQQAPLAGKIENYTYRNKTYQIPAAYLQYQKKQLAMLTVSNDHKGHVMVVSYIGTGSSSATFYRFTGQLRYFASLYSLKDFMAAYTHGTGDYLTKTMYAATHAQPIVNPDKKSLQFTTSPMLYQFEGMNQSTSHAIYKQNIKSYKTVKLTSLFNSVLDVAQINMLNTAGENADLYYQTADTSQIIVDPLGIFVRVDE